MLNYKFINFKLLILFCVILFSCENNYTNEDAKKYLPGKYSFEFPTGDISILKINKDFTYSQIIYSKNIKKVLYNTNGKIIIKGNEISFTNWMSFTIWLNKYYNDDSKIKLRPDYTYSVSSTYYWRKPENNYWTKGVIIIIYFENDYVFEKINN